MLRRTRSKIPALGVLQMKKIVRLVRLAITAPFVLLANIFDWLSELAHCVVDRLAPEEKTDAC